MTCANGTLFIQVGYHFAFTLQLAAAYFSLGGSKYAKRLYTFIIVAFSSFIHAINAM